MTFAIVARYFVDNEELVGLLAEDTDESEREARALVQQVEGKGYNSPRRERILQWQAEQEFEICPTPDDPDSCNVYNELTFPAELSTSFTGISRSTARRSPRRAPTL